MAISNVSGKHNVTGSNVSGARIHELRIRLNMSAEYFGRRCNLSTNQQLLIEKGRSPVTEELVAGILKEFGGADPDNLRSWLTCETDELHIHGEPLINQEEAAIQRLHSVFDESGLSQREFCKRIGVSSTNLGYVFSGKQKFTEKFAKKIEDAFGVGADWLLYGDEKNKEFPCGEEMLGYLKRHPEKRKIVWKWMHDEKS